MLGKGSMHENRNRLKTIGRFRIKILISFEFWIGDFVSVKRTHRLMFIRFFFFQFVHWRANLYTSGIFRVWFVAICSSLQNKWIQTIACSVCYTVTDCSTITSILLRLMRILLVLLLLLGLLLTAHHVRLHGWQMTLLQLGHKRWCLMSHHTWAGILIVWIVTTTAASNNSWMRKKMNENINRCTKNSEIIMLHSPCCCINSCCCWRRRCCCWNCCGTMPMFIPAPPAAAAACMFTPMGVCRYGGAGHPLRNDKKNNY